MSVYTLDVLYFHQGNLLFLLFARDLEIILNVFFSAHHLFKTLQNLCLIEPIEC